MSLKSDKANTAMENYLDDLFQPEIDDLPNQLNSAQLAKPVQSKKSFQLGTDTSLNTVEKRHQIERVERLLDDYNQRSQIKSKTLTDANVSLLRPVLEPLTEEIKPDEVEPEVSVGSENSEQKIVESVKRSFNETEFQALLFNVAGMDIAVPLISLGGIHRMDKEVTELFGKPDWFMGLTPGIDGNINVVDSCRWVMPERYGEAKTKGLNYSFIIMLGESHWGLACSHVQTAITVHPDNIKWRAKHSKRPWLAGMLIEERCVLLDANVMIDLLNSDYQR